MGVCQTIFHFDPQALLALPKKIKKYFPLSLSSAGKHRHNLCGSIACHPGVALEERSSYDQICEARKRGIHSLLLT